MCVIAVIDEKRPSREMVEKMWRTNEDGGSVAYRKDGYVYWKKGLNEREMIQACAELPLPFIVHFRKASIGAKIPELCHPFTIDKEASIALEGRTKGYVLFHNGTWNEWKKYLIDTVIQYKAKLPVGKWNDTRAMAFISNYTGHGFVDFIEAKGIAFGPADMDCFAGLSGWEEVDGIWCSNRVFDTKYFPKHEEHTGYPTGGEWYNRDKPEGKMCHNGKCTRRDLDKDGWCPLHALKIVKDAVTPPGRSLEVRKPGGASERDPFFLLARAIRMNEEGTLSNKKLKKQRKFLEGEIRKILTTQPVKRAELTH